MQFRVIICVPPDDNKIQETETGCWNKKNHFVLGDLEAESREMVVAILEG